MKKIKIMYCEIDYLYFIGIFYDCKPNIIIDKFLIMVNLFNDFVAEVELNLIFFQKENIYY